MTEGEEEICGFIRFSDGFEWICVKKPHDPAYKRKKSDRRHRKGDVVHGTGSQVAGPNRDGRAPASEQHYFITRWPYRKNLNGES